MKVISIGHSCVPANYIRRWCGQKEAYPFDWLVVPPPALLDLARSNFNTDPIFDNLVVHEIPKADKPYIPIKNPTSEIIFYHEFTALTSVNYLHGPDKDIWREQIGTVKQKYKFLADRLRDLLSKPGRVVFIRHHMKNHEAKELVKELDKVCPHGYELITVNEDKPITWDLPPNTKNIFIKESPIWSGDEREWRKVWQQI